jgi:hypothetical protein
MLISVVIILPQQPGEICYYYILIEKKYYVTAQKGTDNG